MGNDIPEEGVEISVEEFNKMKRNGYYRIKEIFLPKIAELYKAGKWQEFCDQVEAVWQIMPEAFYIYYNEMPEQYRRNFVINCYMHHGDSIPACRKALRKLPKNGKNELPEEYRNEPYITIFRAGEEPLEKAKYRLSWTLSEETALFFLKRYQGRHAQAIYKAKIKPEDVIAYTDDREEKEVLQYNKAYDVELYRRKPTAEAGKARPVEEVLAEYVEAKQGAGQL